ncbi:putative high affinity potassium transporter [[Candida] railenensis]|uniref:High affinity potassium transporter n=1 Tax=[Candida] railenensis TaxID=45579 RepID=A0A9P0QLK6_9ASCO|nr:putative high affinity potassium transporter [[Candida] railenensis]
MPSTERSPLIYPSTTHFDTVSVNSDENQVSEDEAEEENDYSRCQAESDSSCDLVTSLDKTSWRNVIYLGFSSLGAIYGDIGTSPLYVLNAVKYPHSPPSQDDIYGTISLIFYLFTFIVIIKYLMIVLVIGPNNGEGGQVAIYAKIARHLKIGPKGVTIPGDAPEKDDDDILRLTRQITSSSFISLTHQMKDLKNSPRTLKFISKLSLWCCFIGCSLVISDGLLTPTTSVLSAITGIQVAKPEFDNVLLVSELVLVSLFVMQQFGSTKLSYFFAPIIFTWLLTLLICGTYNIIVFHPMIFKALSPAYAFNILKKGGLDIISGSMLAITGTEAMFADIGHFGRLPVQLSLTLVVYPSLIFCYLGQGAYLIHNPEAISNPFFMSIPGGLNGKLYWFVFILATISTIIASQALILGVFSIISQLINLDYFPKLKIVHVDRDYIGKVYIPSINWFLMFGVLATTAFFETSERVTAAYGLGISLDFLVTSILIIICMTYVYEWRFIFSVIFAFAFIPFELFMIQANLRKLYCGAWFSILSAFTFFTFLYFWNWARSKKVDQEFAARVKIGDLYPQFKRAPPNENEVLRLGENDSRPEKTKVRGRSYFRFQEELSVEFNVSLHNRQEITPSRPEPKYQLKINSFAGNQVLKRYEGVGIMYTEAYHTLNSPNTVPQIYRQMIETFTCIPSIFIFCTIKVLSIPTILDEEERILLGSMKIPGHYRCIVRFGFCEDVQIKDDIISKIINMVPDSMTLTERFNRYGIINKIESVPILHIFENELIRSYQEEHDHSQSALCKVRAYSRKLLINNIFGPIDNALRSKDYMLKVDDEHLDNQKRIFIGNIVRI